RHRTDHAREPHHGRTGTVAIGLSRPGCAGPQDRVCRSPRRAADQVGDHGIDDHLASRPMTDERYPIGRYTPVSALSTAERVASIEQTAAVPAHFRRAVARPDDAP